MTKKKTTSQKPQKNQQEDLQQELQNLKTTLEEKDEQLLRALADLQNVRRRAEDDRRKLPQIGAEQVIIALLPTLDTLELAIRNIPDEKNDWTSGVESILSGMLKQVSDEGLEKISKAGVPIDPEMHEVLAVDENAKKGEVGEVLQPGYTFRGKVLRAAKVKGGM